MCLMPSRSLPRKLIPAFTYSPCMTMSSGSFTMMIFPEPNDEPSRHVVHELGAEGVSTVRQLGDRINRDIVGHAVREEKRRNPAGTGVLYHGPKPLGRHHCLETAPVSADAKRPIDRIDRHMPNFPGKALRSRHELSVGDDARTQPFIQRIDDDEIRPPRGNALFTLRDGLVAIDAVDENREHRIRFPASREGDR